MQDKRHQMSQEHNTDDITLRVVFKLYCHPTVFPALILMLHDFPFRFSTSERAFAVYLCTEIWE